MGVVYFRKKSYDAAVFCLSPEILFQVQYKNMGLNSRVAYSLISFASRPDDNYVKQTGIKSPHDLKLVSVRDYQNLQISVSGYCSFGKNMKFSAGYLFLYRKYNIPSEFTFLENQ